MELIVLLILKAKTFWYARILEIKHRRIVGLFLILASSGVMQLDIGSASAAPALFFYPPALRLSDGSIVSTVPTLSAAEITTLFPDVSEMSGVVLIVNWSQLCPYSKSCDFSIIDQVLSYWKMRGKRVVLAVATVGFPYKVLEHGQARYQSATPDWVLDQVNTYRAETRGFGRIHNETKTNDRFPSYSDPNFITLVAQLVRQLARYDGNATIAQIRISTGLLTEDNPSPAGSRWLIPGYTDLMWIDYCRQVAMLYLESFHHSQLEFDIGFTGLAYARGNAEVKDAVDRFYSYLIASHFFLAYDGLRSTTLGMLSPNADPRSGVSRGLQYLLEAEENGCAVGLEGGPLTAGFMQNIDSIIQTIEKVKPSRLVLWSTEAALLNEERNGNNEKNQPTLEWLRSQPTASLESLHVHSLLDRLGYK